MLLRRFSKCSLHVKKIVFNMYCSKLCCAFVWYSLTVTVV